MSIFDWDIPRREGTNIFWEPWNEFKQFRREKVMVSAGASIQTPFEAE
jgi:hypothetical protein